MLNCCVRWRCDGVGLQAVELRKNEVAVAVVLGACGLRLRVCARVGSSAAACADGGAGCAAAG